VDRYILASRRVPVGPQEDIAAQDRLRQEIAEEMLVSQVAKAWPYGATILTILGALAGNRILFTLGIFLAAALAVAWLWTRYVLRAFYLKREPGQRRAFFGEEVEVTYTFTNFKPLPVPWLHMEDEIPSGLEVTSIEAKPAAKGAEHLALSLSLRPYERVTLKHRLLGKARGEYLLNNVTLESGDIFGIFRKIEVRTLPETLIVYPRYVPVEELGIPARQAFGEHKSLQRLVTDPLRIKGVREYAWGDSPRHIHWRATARKTELQTKLFEPAATPQLFVFCNQDTFARVWEGIDREALEFNIIVAASLAGHALDEGYMTGLQVNSFTSRSDSPVRLAPGRSPDQFTRILENLARVRGWSGQPIEEILAAERRKLPRGSSLVVVTAVVTPDLVDVLAAIRRSGHPVTLVETAVANVKMGPQMRRVPVEKLASLNITYHSVRAEGRPAEVEVISL
jgi:uncharacterized protein (DUF58 family)